MKDDWDSMLNLAQKQVEEDSVNVAFLKILLEQISNKWSMLHDKKMLAIIHSLNTKIDDNMVKKMSKYKTGKELLLHFYEELQKDFFEEQKMLLDDIFSEVTQWVKQQK